MMSQLDTASMRHMTHEKMKSHIVQGKAEMKSPFQQKKPNSRETEFFLLGPRGILQTAASAQYCLLWFLWFCSGHQRCHHHDCSQGSTVADEL